MPPARQRALIAILGLVAAGVVGWSAWWWEVWAQRRAIAALHASEAQVRAAAVREFHAMAPRLREEVLPRLIAALEEGWATPPVSGDAISLASSWWHRKESVFLGSYWCADLIALHPDFWAPAASSIEDPPDLTSPRSRGILDADELLAQLGPGMGEEEIIGVLSGKLFLRAPLEKHLELMFHLGALRRRACLFHELFPPDLCRALLPALDRLTGHAGSPSWLRFACARAAGRARTATHTADT